MEISDYQADQTARMAAKFPIGTIVKWSPYALRSSRDLYLNTGEPRRRAGYQQQYEDKRAERFTVESIAHSSQGYPYLVLSDENGHEVQTGDERVEIA